MSRVPWLPGLAVASGLGLLTTAFQPLTGHPIPGLDPITAALLLGVVVGNAVGAHSPLAPGTKLAGKHVLSLAVVLLGASLNLLGLGDLGWAAWAGVLVAMGLVMVAGRPLGRLLGLSVPTAFLVATGTAICGSSAIAAVAPMVREKSESDVGISVAVVNLLGAVMMVVLPIAFTVVGLDPEQGAVLLGGSLQAVGHVVGAASGLADGQVETATAVKMGRVAMLVPFVLVLGLRDRSHTDDDPATKRKLRLPPYLVGFLALSVLSTAGILSPAMVAAIKPVAKFLLAIAMAGIGCSVQLSLLRRAGPRAMLLGVVLFVVQLAAIGAGLLV